MRLTTKGRFAVTAMVDLAMQHGSGPVTLAEISHRQRISLSYLEQLFGKLRRRDLNDRRYGPRLFRSQRNHAARRAGAGRHVAVLPRAVRECVKPARVRY